MNNVFKIIIIIIIKIIIIKVKKKKKESNGGGASQREGVEIEGEKIFFYFFSFRFFLKFTKIGPSIFVGAEGKVDLRDESYVWTQKSLSFVKLHEVENFPTCVISILKAI